MANINGTSNADVLNGTTQGDAIKGFGGDDELYGDAGNDTLEGGEGDDVLAGGAGVDRLVGGNGDDGYVIDDDSADTIVEASDGGIDAVLAFHDYTLPTNIEILYLYAGRKGVGNDQANALLAHDGGAELYGLGGDDFLIGGAGNDRLDGGTGADQLEGGAGDDTYVIDSVNDRVIDSGGIDTILTSVSWLLGSTGEHLTMQGSGDLSASGNTFGNTIIGNTGKNRISGGSGADTLHGGDGDDTLLGGSGADSLYGDRGADTLLGGTGNDTYYLGSGPAPDTVSEEGGGGIDTVLSIFDYALVDGVENLTLLGGLRGQGNSLANSIIGNRLANTLLGEAGDDTLDGGDGDDTLEGGAGNDLLIGGVGTDLLKGGRGDDVYHLDPGNVRRDTVSEADGGGTDTVVSGFDYTLLDGFENLILTAGVRGQGNAANNTILGHGGANTLLGDAGNDKLEGAAGDDRLEGGIGNDTLTGGLGRDAVYGGEGNDTLVIFPKTDLADGEIYDGGAGSDNLVLSGLRHTDRVDLGQLPYASIEKVTTGGTLVMSFATLKSFTTVQASAVRLTDGGTLDTKGLPWLWLYDALYLSDQDTTLDLGRAEGGRNDGMDIAIVGGAGDDVLTGGGATAFRTVDLDGGGGDDILRAGNNDQTFLTGGRGKDMVYGGDKDDVLVVTLRDLAAGEIYDGGGGRDQLKFEALREGDVLDIDLQRITLLNVESFVGPAVRMSIEDIGRFDYFVARDLYLKDGGLLDFDGSIGAQIGSIHFTDLDTVLDLRVPPRSGQWNRVDNVYGGGGNDTVYGGADVTNIDGGGGDDIIHVGSASKVTGGTGADHFVMSIRETWYLADYEDGADKFDVSDLGYHSFEEMVAAGFSVRDWGLYGTRIELGRGASITMDRLPADTIDASDFLFA